MTGTKTVLAVLVVIVTCFILLVPAYGFDQEWIAAFSAVGTIWAVAVAVWAILALREDRLEGNKPRVVVWLRVSFKQTLWLEVENRGNSIAQDVRFRFDPAPRRPELPALDEVPAFRDGVSSLLPGERLLPFILWFGARLDEIDETAFDLTVSYRDELGQEHEFNRHFDLEQLRHLQLRTRTVEESLADHQSGLLVKVDKLNYELARINDQLTVIAEGQARGDSEPPGTAVP